MRSSREPRGDSHEQFTGIERRVDVVITDLERGLGLRGRIARSEEHQRHRRSDPQLSQRAPELNPLSRWIGEREQDQVRREIVQSLDRLARRREDDLISFVGKEPRHELSEEGFIRDEQHGPSGRARVCRWHGTRRCDDGRIPPEIDTLDFPIGVGPAQTGPELSGSIFDAWRPRIRRGCP